MSRVDDAAEIGLYEVAAEVRDRCVRRADALATPGRSIWTASRLANLQSRRPLADVDDPLEPDSIADALAPLDDALGQLAAEVLYLHCLGLDPDDLPPEQRRAIVDAARSSVTRSFAWPDRMLEALEVGFEDAEVTFEGFETSFWVRWIIELRQLAPHERADVLSDPWRLRTRVRRLEGESDTPTRHLALHLFAPDTFEPLPSDDCKHAIADAFRTYVPLDPDPNVDHQLLELRQWLRDERDVEVDTFRDERVAWFWRDESRATEFLEWIAFFYENWTRFDAEERDYKLEVARRGEPLREAVRSEDDAWLEALESYFGADANNLVNWRTASSFQSWCREQPERARRALQRLWGEGTIGERIDAFCEQLGDEVGSGPGTRLRLTAALSMIEAPTRFPPYQQSALRDAYELADVPPPAADDEATRYGHALDFFDQIREDLDMLGVDLRDRLDAQGLVWTLVQSDLDDLDFLYPPERGDFAEFRGGDYETPDPEPRDVSIESLAERLGFSTSSFRETAEHLRTKGQIVLYGPPGTGKTHYARHFALWWLAVEHQRVPDVARELTGDRDGNPRLDWGDRLLSVTFHPSYTYEDFVEGFRPARDGDGPDRLQLEDGLFKRLCHRAEQSPDETFLLLIDEINRANLPKVFGELLTVLERDKRGTPVRLPQSRESLVVPENLYILGTMNTVDRSLRHLDAALRRRFRFLERMPDPEVLGDADVHGLSLADLLEQLNERIVRREGRAKQIGHAYLLDASGEPIDTPRAFARVMRYEIVPLLQEYCYDDFQRLEVYLGSDIVDVRRRALRDDVLDDPERLVDALREHLLSP